MPVARVVEVAQAVADGISARWSPVSPDAVQRVYEVEIGTTPEDASLIAGRQVYVFPGSYFTDYPATRGRDTLAHDITVVMAERYTAAGPVPAAWLDERLYWAEQTVWLYLDSPRVTPVLAGVYPFRAEVLAYDLEELVGRKLWLSVVSATLREVR